MLNIKLSHFKKPLILLLLVMVISITSIYLIKKAIVKSSYFNIKRIVLTGASDIEPPQDLLGKNLFSIDLQQVQKRLMFDYPELRDVEISRSLPSVLVIDIEPRLPIAKLKLYGKTKFYFIDKEATILGLLDQKQYATLPEISGVGRKVKNLTTGETINSSLLDIALKVLEEYADIEELKQYAIEEIDVSDLNDAFFKIRLGGMRLKIIIGREQISQRLKVLSALLSKIRSNLSGIRYIDLRFKDPVTG